MRRFSVFFAVSMFLVACQSGPYQTAYKAGTLYSERQRDYDMCKIQSFREIPQNLAVETKPGYYNPGTVQCTNIGNYTSCQNVGAVNIPATSSTYDVNENIRFRFIDNCMSAKGYQFIQLPVCTKEADKRAALYSPQPDSPAMMTCTAGVNMDN